MKKGLKILIPILVLALLASVFCIGIFAEEQNEAKVGSTEYKTLAAAVNAINNTAAMSGSTITLLKDVALTSHIGINVNMTVDLNGHTITNTNSDKAQPVFAVNGSGAVFTVTGRGEIESSSRFAQISSSGGANAQLNIKGTAGTPGIVVKTTGAGATMIYLDGTGTIENTTFLCYGTLDDSRQGHLQLAGGLVSFKNCSLYSTAPSKNLFYFAEEGAQLKLENCFTSVKQYVFYGNFTNGVKNADDFKIVEATNCVLMSDGGYNANSSVLNARSKGPTKLAGTFDFTGCELSGYRVFETGSDSLKDPEGNAYVSGGLFEEGYNLTVNVKDCLVRSVVHYNSPGIVRGHFTFNAENCRFNISSGFSAANANAGQNWSDASKINIKNCYFNKDVSTDNAFKLPTVGILARGYSWINSTNNLTYPYYVCATSDAPTSKLPVATLVMNGNLNKYFAATGPAPLVGTTDNESHQKNTIYGGEINMKLGKMEVIRDHTDAYLKYTFTDVDGNLPANPTDITYLNSKAPYFVIGDDNEPNKIAFKDAALIVVDLDVMMNDFGRSQIGIIPQARTSSGKNLAKSGAATFKVTSGKIGNLTAHEKQWQHLQIVITVKKTNVPASGDNKAYVDYTGTTYAVYLNGRQIKPGTAYENAFINADYLIKDGEKITGYNEPYFQGIRFNAATDCTTGASLSIDNTVIRSYKNASDFTNFKFNSESSYTSSGYTPARNVAVAKGVSYKDYGKVPTNSGVINLFGNATVKVGYDTVVITDTAFSADKIANSTTTGYADTKNGTFYGKDTQWKTTTTASSGFKVGTTAYVYTLGDKAKTVYYSHSKLSLLAGLNSSGVPYAGADTEQEMGWLISGLQNGATARMQQNITLSGNAFAVNFNSAREISFDLNGYILKKTTKIDVFSGLKNTTFNLYSSKPGGQLRSRNTVDHANKGTDKNYSFSTNSGFTVFNIESANSVVNVGDYKDFSGNNLTVYAAIFYDVAKSASNAECNVNGGQYIRNVFDSRGLFSSRSENSSVINLNKATVLTTAIGGGALLNIENGSNARIIADGCTFYSQTKNNGTSNTLFTYLSANGEAKFTNCSFSNLNLTANDGTDASSKVILGVGNTYSASCDASGVEYEAGVAPAALKSGWKQTMANGESQLAFHDVYGVSSSKKNDFYYNTVTYHVYNDSTGKHVYAWTGSKTSAEKPAPTGSFTTVFGDINDPFNGSASDGYTYDTTKNYEYMSYTGYTSEGTRTAYIVSSGATSGIASGTNVLQMPDQAYVTLKSGQVLATYEIGESKTTVAKDASDTTPPVGFELPSSKNGVYTYSYNATTQTVGDVTYITYTCNLTVDVTLSSNISLNDNFTYNIFIPKTLVAGGDINGSIKLNGKDITLSETYEDDYVVYIEDISAINAGDENKVVITVNLGADALAKTAQATYTYSIPAYASKVLATSDSNEAKQMMADVLAYVKAAMDFAGAPYTTASGYSSVTSAIASFTDEGFAPTDTSSVDFGAIAKAPSADALSKAVWAATFNLDTTVKARFYLSEGYTGTVTLTYKALTGTDVPVSFEVVDGKYDGVGYIELALKAYYVAGDITVSFDGQTATQGTTFNLAAYIAGTQDADAVAAAKALYAYSASALAYQQS